MTVFQSNDSFAGIAPYGDLRRANKLGVHFRRQQIIQGFIVDFYCHPVKSSGVFDKAALVAEVDGDIHDLQQEEDARREKVLREMGLRVVRFGNDETRNDIAGVVRVIEVALRGE